MWIPSERLFIQSLQEMHVLLVMWRHVRRHKHWPESIPVRHRSTE